MCFSIYEEFVKKGICREGLSDYSYPNREIFESVVIKNLNFLHGKVCTLSKPLYVDFQLACWYLYFEVI